MRHETDELLENFLSTARKLAIKTETKLSNKWNHSQHWLPILRLPSFGLPTYGLSSTREHGTHFNLSCLCISRGRAAMPSATSREHDLYRTPEG